MKYKYDEEYLKQLCVRRNLEFIGFSYRTFDKKRRCADFICNKHREWGVQSKPVEKMAYAQPCKYCNHKALKENFKEEVYRINPNIEVLEDYVNSDAPILCRCKIHNYEWLPISRGLLQGEGCPLCGYYTRWDERGRITTEEFRDRMEKINPNIEIIGEYKGSHKLIKCKCKIHKNEWESYACNLQNESAGCPICNDASITRLLSQEEFLLRLKEKTPHIMPLSKYSGIRSNMNFFCKEHQINFEATPHSFLYKNLKGCPLCSQSLGERRLINLLLKKGRNISTQYMFDDCVYKQKLRFDVYDIDNQIAYEYQGQQHYYPVPFTGDIAQAEQNFKEGKIRDMIKEQYCKENNITLIKIPYWDFDDMEKYIY